MSIAVILCTILATLCLGYSIFLHIKVAAFEKSTHNIQYVPIDPDFSKESKEQMQKLNKDFKEYVEDDYSDIFKNPSF